MLASARSRRGRSGTSACGAWCRGPRTGRGWSVFRSLNHIYAQVVDDAGGKTLVAVDSRAAEFRAKLKKGGNVAAAKLVGELVAQRAKAKGIGPVVFDRGGYQYHGRVKALAEAARAGGLAF